MLRGGGGVRVSCRENAITVITGIYKSWLSHVQVLVAFQAYSRHGVSITRVDSHHGSISGVQRSMGRFRKWWVVIAAQTEQIDDSQQQRDGRYPAMSCVHSVVTMCCCGVCD